MIDLAGEAVQRFGASVETRSAKRPPGGTTTTLTRILAQKLTDAWGQSVVVDNRGGGNTVIGTEALVKSPPDGYLFVLATLSSTGVAKGLYANLPYDPVADFAPVGMTAWGSLVLVAPVFPAAAWFNGTLASSVWALRAQARLFSARDHVRALGTGDVYAVVGTSADLVPLAERAPSVALVAPQSGTALWADLWAVPAASSDTAPASLAIARAANTSQAFSCVDV